MNKKKGGLKTPEKETPIVTVDGLFGVGKSVTIERLKGFLNGVHKKIGYMDFPWYDDDPLYRMYESNEKPSINVILNALNKLIPIFNKNLKEIQQENDIIIIERYYYSFLAYIMTGQPQQKTKEKYSAKEIMSTHFSTLTRPSVSFILDAAAKVICLRNVSKPTGAMSLFPLNESYLSKVVNNLSRFKGGTIEHVNTHRPLPIIAASMFRTINMELWNGKEKPTF